MSQPIYPFIPKSTRHLKRGQFWAILLKGGHFGAGCVIGTYTRNGKPSTRLFIAGVVHWAGNEPLTCASIAGQPVVDFAFVHINAITEAGGAILGEARLELSSKPSSAESTSLQTWGFGVPKLLAERVATNAA